MGLDAAASGLRLSEALLPLAPLPGLASQRTQARSETSPRNSSHPDSKCCHDMAPCRPSPCPAIGPSLQARVAGRRVTRTGRISDSGSEERPGWGQPMSVPLAEFLLASLTGTRCNHVRRLTGRKR